MRSIIIRFSVSLTSFVIAALRIGLGYVPSSRLKYDRITAEGNPVSFWITIGFLLLVSAVFFLLGSWSIVKYIRSNK